MTDFAPETLAGSALVAAVEALLFASDRALSPEHLRHCLPEPRPERQAVLDALQAVLARHAPGEGRGITLEQAEGRYQFRTTPENAGYLAELTGLRPVKLSRAALETLAIVAYRQPVTRGEIERVRGVDSGGVVRALLERKLVRVAGRRDEPGRPMVYGTTPTFLDTFGLGSLEGLPSLREFTQLGDEDIEAVQELLADDPTVKKQVTFDEYAARQARDRVDAAVDERLADPTAEEPA